MTVPIFCDFPARNTIYAPFVDGSVQPYECYIYRHCVLIYSKDVCIQKHPTYVLWSDDTASG